jgi:hypothetical protein
LVIDSDSSTPRNELQEFLSLLHDAASSPDAKSRDIRLLRAWGVFRYILSGPMTCEHCQVQVRLAIPLTSERISGEVLHYDCLCTRCTFDELGLARRIIMQVGSARVEYCHEDSVSKRD